MSELKQLEEESLKIVNKMISLFPQLVTDDPISGGDFLQEFASEFATCEALNKLAVSRQNHDTGESIYDRLQYFMVRPLFEVTILDDNSAELYDPLNCITARVDVSMSDERISELVEF